jgi:RNA polymerase sigma factor (sigma-70 family)
VTPGAPEGPDRDLERTLERARARRALDQLAARDREMLLMRYEGFSYKEIADVVNVAASSVGTLLARAEARFVEAVGVGEERA